MISAIKLFFQKYKEYMTIDLIGYTVTVLVILLGILMVTVFF